MGLGALLILPYLPAALTNAHCSQQIDQFYTLYDV